MKVSEITESVYPSNVGIMELVQFYKIASDSEKQTFDQLMSTSKLSAAWKLIQQVTGTKLQGMEFESILEKLSKVGEQWALVSKKDPHQAEHKVHTFEDIPRNQMPQIDLHHIKGNYKFKQGLINISKIKPVQSERTAKDTAGARTSVSNGKAKPIILDRDGYIVNGHHRYDAYLAQGYNQIPVIKVDATLSELMQAFSHTVEENFADGKEIGVHRSSEDFAVIDLSKSADGTFWLNGVDNTDWDSTVTTGQGVDLAFEISSDANLATWDNINKYSVDELENMGYDGVRMEDGDNVAYQIWNTNILKRTKLGENFADGKVKGKSRPGRFKKAGVNCKGSVTSLRKKAKNSSGEKQKGYHWCANMKSGRK